MRKIIFIFILMMLSFSSYCQTVVTFWTNEPRFGKIDVYFNDSYAGTITHSYTSAPSCGAAGCVTVHVTQRHNTWSAKAEDGSVWSSSSATLSKKCNTQLLYGTPNTGNKGSGNTGSSTPPSPDGPDVALAAAVVAAAALVAVGTTYVNNDIYVSNIGSGDYRGIGFGFRNNMNKHIDFEIGTTCMKNGAGWLSPGFKTDYPYITYKDDGSLKNIWSLDFNLVYNVFERGRKEEYISGDTGQEGTTYYYKHEPLVNPYVGFATSTILNDDNLKGDFGFGGIVGVSVGKRLRFHMRYKWMKNFAYNRVLANQFEIGLSFTYKYGWGFKHKHADF